MSRPVTPLKQRIDLGYRVRFARTTAGLSQRQLADGLEKVSPAFISRIESGDRWPSARTIRQLADRLGVPAYWLETGDRQAELVLTRGDLDELLLLSDPDTDLHRRVVAARERLKGIPGRDPAEEAFSNAR